MTLADVVLLFLAAYGAGILIMLAGLRRLRDAVTDAPPTVSVVIAARNEGAIIGACLDAVCTQTFNRTKYEVIVVDDDSDDDTAAVVLGRMATYPNLRLARVVADPNLRGKSRPLSTGIDRATGEVILITDADCVVPPTWVEATASRYAADVGLVGGMTLQDSDSRFGGIQSLDWAFLLGIAASSVAYGRSFGSIGNNLSFRKEAYTAVGGYRVLPFSVTEDYTLVAAIRKTGRWRQLYPIDPELLVVSRPCPDVRTLIRQKHRWGRGGLDVPFSGYVIMAVTWLLHILTLVYLFGWYAWGYTLTVMMVKAVFDYAFLFAVLRRAGRTSDLRHFAAFEAYLGLYVILLPFLVAVGGKVNWKERTY